MITKRIIPCLDVRSGRVVKGTNFEGIRDVADPVEMARMYNAAGADELVFYDITASFEGRTLFTDILTRVASEVFIPLTVGGGINTLEDFAGCCAALTVLFLLRSSWLTEGFSAVLSALCLFAPFEEFVNSNFSIPTLVYYLTVTVLFLFFTVQELEKRRWN